LIYCLAKYESTNNSKAFNPEDIDGRPKYGLLQFDAGTFQYYCLEKYHYADDIWDGEIQSMCADQMIDNGELHQWGTYKLCI
jgi:hypothetical protein